MECFNCSVSGDKVKLFDAISGKGIVKICEKCSFEERLPIVRKPTIFQLEESEKKYSVYERLSRNASIEPKKIKEDKPIKKELEEMKKILREVSNKNYEQKIQTNPKLMPGLVDNFHWIIMRVRRLKKLTQEQLAKEIYEPEASIKMAEQGILSEGNYELVKKLESYLGIKLLKREFKNKKGEISEEQTKKSEFDLKEFDLKNVENITIADLKKMKEEKEAKILGSFEEKKEGENS